MLMPIVVLYLFGLGVLVLAGQWRIERAARRATMQRGLLTRRVARLSRRVFLLTRPCVRCSVRECSSPPRKDLATWNQLAPSALLRVHKH